MSMISELVKGLRKLGNQWKHNDVAGFNLIFDAADTIETLSEKVRVNNLHNGWIPVSERLPERNRSVLVYESIYENIYAAYYDSAYGWMTFDPCWNGCFPEYLNIIAWMPLPEPYKGGGTE